MVVQCVTDVEHVLEARFGCGVFQIRASLARYVVQISGQVFVRSAL